MKRAGMKPAIDRAMVLDRFKKEVGEIMGKEAAEQVRPLYVRNKVITVACLSSALAQEIKFKEAEIVGRVNEEFKQSMIERVLFEL